MDSSNYPDFRRDEGGGVRTAKVDSTLAENALTKKPPR
jgi:hypothetical protein